MNKDFLEKSNKINKYFKLFKKISNYSKKYKKEYDKQYNYAKKHNKNLIGGKEEYINNSIFSDIFIENGTYAKLLKKKSKINMNYNKEPIKMFEKLIKQIDDIGLELDKKPIELYNKVKLQFEIFNKDFRQKISKLYGFDVSQGGIKMNEMISTFKDLVPTDKKVVKSFHICEAPGSFIYMLRYYVKDILGHKLEWKSQSINPYHKNTLTKFGPGLPALKNDLLKDKNGEWVTGNSNKNIGNITNIKTIKSYSKYCKDVDIITADCGMGGNVRGKHAEKLVFFTILFMLMNVPLGKNCLMKLYLPINSELYIYMIYLLYRYFKKVYIYKPIVNFRSEEFYIVCIGKKEVPDKLIKKLSKKSIEYPKVSDLSFLLQLYDYTKLIIDKRELQLKRLIYLMDNYDLISKSEFKLMKQIKEKRFKEWIKKYSLIK